MVRIVDEGNLNAKQRKRQRQRQSDRKSEHNFEDPNNVLSRILLAKEICISKATNCLTILGFRLSSNLCG
jgi:hypothetical protein